MKVEVWKPSNIFMLFFLIACVSVSYAGEIGSIKFTSKNIKANPVDLAAQHSVTLVTEYHYITGASTTPTTFNCSTGGWYITGSLQPLATASASSTAYSYQCMVPFSQADQAVSNGTYANENANWVASQPYTSDPNATDYASLKSTTTATVTFKGQNLIYMGPISCGNQGGYQGGYYGYYGGSCPAGPIGPGIFWCATGGTETCTFLMKSGTTTGNNVSVTSFSTSSPLISSFTQSVTVGQTITVTKTASLSTTYNSTTFNCSGSIVVDPSMLAAGTVWVDCCPTTTLYSGIIGQTGTYTYNSSPIRASVTNSKPCP